MNDNVQTMIFAIAMIFQLSGALLLVLQYFMKIRKKITYEYFDFNRFVVSVDKQMEKLKLIDKNRLTSILDNIFMNRFAFSYITAGYALAVIGNNRSDNPIILAVVIVLVSLLISIVTSKIVATLSKNNVILDKYSVVNNRDVIIGSIVSTVEDEI